MIGRVRGARGSARWIGWLAAGVVVLSLTACGRRSYHDDKADHTVAVNVRSAGGDPVVGLTAAIWILDMDMPFSARDPQAMEPKATDFDGRAEWTYKAYETPVVCGYRIVNGAGDVVASASPAKDQQLSVVPGEVTVTLMP